MMRATQYHKPTIWGWLKSQPFIDGDDLGMAYGIGFPTLYNIYMFFIFPYF
jgi:hypothetical protein